jgi:glycosyltransferase involved in cell wall biosynthesis
MSSETSAKADKALKLAYLALETPRPGQASFTHIQEISRSLERLGWRVDLFATSNGGASIGAWRFSRAIDYLRVQWQLLLAFRKYDAVFIRSHPASALIILAAVFAGKPVFQEVNGSDLDLWITYPKLRPFKAIIRLVWRWQFARSTHLFCVTDGLLAWATKEAGHRNASIVPNGADTQTFSPDGEKVACCAKAYAIFVGGLVAWHGLQCMIDALYDPHWPDEVDLVIVGDGPERGVLQASKNSRLKWLPSIPYGDVAKHLRGAIAALCVIEDTQGRSSTGVAPLKLYEAMACGIPVIVSDLPFQGDLVRSIGAGLVVPQRSPVDIARAVRGLVDSPAKVKAMGAAGAAYVARFASWDQRAKIIDMQMRAAVGK